MAYIQKNNPFTTTSPLKNGDLPKFSSTKEDAPGYVPPKDSGEIKTYNAGKPNIIGSSGPFGVIGGGGIKLGVGLLKKGLSKIKSFFSKKPVTVTKLKPPVTKPKTKISKPKTEEPLHPATEKLLDTSQPRTKFDFTRDALYDQANFSTKGGYDAYAKKVAKINFKEAWPKGMKKIINK